MTYAEELRKKGRQKSNQQPALKIAKKLLNSIVDSKIITSSTNLSIAKIDEF